MCVMVSRQWGFSNFRNASRLKNNGWEEISIYGTMSLSGLQLRPPLGKLATQGKSTHADCQVWGSRAWQLRCSSAGIPKNYELLAFPLTPTVVQVDLELCWSHLHVKWTPWAKALAKFKPSSLHPWRLYLKKVDARFPLDFQCSKSPEDPPNFGQPGSDQPLRAPSRTYSSSLPSPFV